MNNSNHLIALYRQALSLESNTAIGKRLGVKQQTVSMWVNEKSHPNAEAIADMCKATGESLAKWLPLIEAERCRTEADRKVWLRLAQVAASITLAVGLSAVAPSTAHAEAQLSARIIGAPCILCQIARRGRRAVGTALAWLRSLAHGAPECLDLATA